MLKGIGPFELMLETQLKFQGGLSDGRLVERGAEGGRQGAGDRLAISVLLVKD
jgi:hypothetical protein